MGAKLAEAERLRAAGDAYKRELLQAKLSEREGELSAAQEKLRAAKREAASAPSSLGSCPELPLLLFRECACDPVYRISARGSAHRMRLACWVSGRRHDTNISRGPCYKATGACRGTGIVLIC